MVATWEIYQEVCSKTVKAASAGWGEIQTTLNKEKKNPVEAVKKGYAMCISGTWGQHISVRYILISIIIIQCFYINQKFSNFNSYHNKTFFLEIGLEDEVDIVQVPDPVPRGVFKPITLYSGSLSLVVFDLDTTDLSKFIKTKWE